MKTFGTPLVICADSIYDHFNSRKLNRRVKKRYASILEFLSFKGLSCMFFSHLSLNPCEKNEMCVRKAQDNVVSRREWKIKAQVKAKTKSQSQGSTVNNVSAVVERDCELKVKAMEEKVLKEQKKNIDCCQNSDQNIKLLESFVPCIPSSSFSLLGFLFSKVLPAEEQRTLGQMVAENIAHMLSKGCQMKVIDHCTLAYTGYLLDKIYNTLKGERNKVHKFEINSQNILVIILACVLLSEKMISDIVIKNGWWAALYGFPLVEINNAERAVLWILDFDIQAEVTVFVRYWSMVAVNTGKAK